MKKILLIEDDELMLKILQRILSKENYEIDTALNGKEAFQKLTASNYGYDLVITDIMMPYANGFEIISKIKDPERKKNIPIIIVSNVNNEDIVLEAFKVGADDYLKKPVMAGELLIRVKRLINLP